MRKAEQHIINRNDLRWSVIDDACFCSKNLFNATLYILRQNYFKGGIPISYAQLAKDMKDNPDYCALPRKVSQWVLKQVVQSWETFFSANRSYNVNPSKFSGRPRLPKYKHKEKGRNLLTYTIQALNKKRLREGIIVPSQLPIEIKTNVDPNCIQQVRIIPRSTHYVVEVIYNDIIHLAKLPPNKIAGIDLGLNNLMAVTSNQQGFHPFLVNGRPLKSINQHYNKEIAKLQSQLPRGQYISERIRLLTDKRNRQIKHYLHCASKLVIAELVRQGIGTLVIGKNSNWKQGLNIGRHNNQKFIQIPHTRLINMLTYKAEQEGITVIITEESYTSKCSFLDNEAIQKHQIYAGKRIKRGLFQSHDKTIINADINASANIIRKVFPKAFADGIEVVVVSPLQLIPV